MRHLIRLLRRLSLVSALALAAQQSPAADLTVSAASSLSQAFKALAPAFEAQNPGTKLRLNVAASDALLAQIAKGAPVDVFASADQESMDRAQARQLLVAGSRRNFVGNALVVVTPSDSRLRLTTLADLQGAEVKRVALGNPASVPAGRYAQRALVAARLWNAIEAKAVLAINARQALDYAARGEVEAAFVFATDAALQKDRVRLALPVPTTAPIRYPVAVVAGTPREQTARRFIDFLMSPAGQAELARHGFLQP